MGRKRTYVPLNVFFDTKIVGQLHRELSGAIRFSYANSWLEWQHAFPVSISLPLRDTRYAGAQVMAVFDNLLPDYDPIRRRVAERVGAAGTDAFSLLTEIGRDCVGALQFIPDGVQVEATHEMSGRVLSDKDVEVILVNLDIAPLGIRNNNDFRISIAGAQEKTALLYHNDQWVEPAGTTPTTHIIKPQIGNLVNGLDLSNSVENEFFCLKLMEAFGLKTARVDIAQFGTHSALVVKRFDRHWNEKGVLKRLPQEDFCQALSIVPTKKYQQEGGPGIVEIMSLLRASDDPARDRYNFFKAQLLFWLIGATDGHAKNFSIALSSQGRFTLAPLYDVLTLQPLFDEKTMPHKDFKMAMRVGNSNQYNVEKIQGRHFLDTGLQSGLSRRTVEAIIDDITSSAGNSFNQVEQSLPTGFSQQLYDSVFAAFHRRLPRLHSI